MYIKKFYDDGSDAAIGGLDSNEVITSTSMTIETFGKLRRENSIVGGLKINVVVDYNTLTEEVSLTGNLEENELAVAKIRPGLKPEDFIGMVVMIDSSELDSSPVWTIIDLAAPEGLSRTKQAIIISSTALLDVFKIAYDVESGYVFSSKDDLHEYWTRLGWSDVHPSTAPTTPTTLPTTPAIHENPVGGHE